MTAVRILPAPGQPVPDWTIDEIIDAHGVRTLFQPIVHLATGSVVGFEALSRGPAGTAFESPLALLEAARVAGRLGELDWLCRAQAMQIAADSALPDALCWLINVEPAGLAMACPPHLAAAQERAHVDLRVILEIVERDVHGNVLDLIRATDDARRDSWGVALDDVGAEEASLALLPILRPDVVKLDMSLVQGTPREATASITAAVRAYAEQRGAVILAEGIETHAQQQLAQVFGATYGQGFYYGKPGPLPVSLDPPIAPVPLRQYVPPLDGRTPVEMLSATITPQRAEKRHLTHITAHLEREAAHETTASVFLAGFQNSAFFSPAEQSRYRQLAASNALTIVLADGLTGHDEPTCHIGDLPAGSRLGEEWIVIVLAPHFAAALVARDCGDTLSEGVRRFDFIYTYDRDAVINAARCFMQDLAIATDRRSVIGPVADPAEHHAGIDAMINAVTAESHGFRATAQLVLDYLNTHLPMGLWSITRVENERQTHLYVGDNDYGLTVGTSVAWDESCCVHMVAGTAPRVAPDAEAIAVYAAVAARQAIQVGAYVGAPIAEPDGTLFGVICGLDRFRRDDLANVGPILDMLSGALMISLATDRALHEAREEASTALTYATIDVVTGTHNLAAWDAAISQLIHDYDTYADPTVIVIVDLEDACRGDGAGDHLLRDAAGVIRRSVRSHDFVARLSDTEFGIILTRTTADLAPTLTHRVIRALDRACIRASGGWSPLRPGSTVHEAIGRAGQATREARQAATRQI